MMGRKQICIYKGIGLLMCFCLLATQAQAEGKRKWYHNMAFGANRTTTDSLLFSNLNVGIFSSVDTLHGFQYGLISSVATREMIGLNMATFFGFSNKTRGVQVAGMTNNTLQPLEGMQLAAVTNVAMGVQRGMQLSGLANICAGRMRGVQTSIYNVADTLTGVQLGVANMSDRQTKGWQIGVVNMSHDSLARKVGFVNIGPHTHIDLLTYAGTSTKLNGALRFRNRHTYTMIGLGTHYLGIDEKFSGALFYRFGRHFQLSPKWMVSGDVGYSHIEFFRQESTHKPQRLYALQAHVNVDYRLGPTMGLFASVGYGDTRHYGSRRRYEQQWIGEVGLSFAYRRNHNLHTTSKERMQQGCAETDGVMAWSQPKRYALAALETTGINALVFSFDKFVMNEDFAQVNIHTIRDNFKRGFVWDNDPFSTNLFAHPYHGNLYFNSARSNGLTFWESAPYAIGGSLMWEMLAECEPPAINDWIATSLGGTCIGEVTHRLSHLILDDSKVGSARFFREAAAFIVNPIQGFNRIVRGDAFQLRSRHHLYHDYNRIPVKFSLALGTRYLADDGSLFRGEHNAYLRAGIEYGDAIGDDNNQPYDYFTAQLSLSLLGNQPLINSARLMGRLWATPIHDGERLQAQFGLFQHFNFYNAEPVKDGTQLTPYRISEAVGIGPGAIYRFLGARGLMHLEQRVFLDGILLGGSKSDYYNVIDRDYNMGSGYAIKSNTLMDFGKFGHFYLNVSYYHIFTWKGYEGKDLTDMNPLYYNVQGDKSDASLMVINPEFQVRLKEGLHLEMSSSYYLRDTRYRYHANVHAETFEVKLGLVYVL